jgi:carbamoyltransferase
MTARFMLLVVPVNEDKQDVIPAVNHLGTARVQMVYHETNPMYHDLIRRFGEATGVPVLLNTSFNVRGEPIVNTPEDAIKTFLDSGIDTLVLGNYLLDK